MNRDNFHVEDPRVVSLSESTFVVSLSRFPFVVSLSNQALREISQERCVLHAPSVVIPAKAGIQGRQAIGNQRPWISAFAGMTGLGPPEGARKAGFAWKPEDFPDAGIMPG